jgi:hypothetical protein
VAREFLKFLFLFGSLDIGSWVHFKVVPFSLREARPFDLLSGGLLGLGALVVLVQYCQLFLQ